MGIERRYPNRHAAFLKQCYDVGQTRPTPLLLQYVPGDFNCLHQDLYGDLAFPLQVAILLSEPGRDFAGGEFVLTEQRPRMQSRVEVVPLRQGDAVAFAVHNRPVQGTKGFFLDDRRTNVFSRCLIHSPPQPSAKAPARLKSKSAVGGINAPHPSDGIGGGGGTSQASGTPNRSPPHASLKVL